MENIYRDFVKPNAVSQCHRGRHLDTEAFYLSIRELDENLGFKCHMKVHRFLWFTFRYGSHTHLQLLTIN